MANSDTVPSPSFIYPDKKGEDFQADDLGLNHWLYRLEAPFAETAEEVLEAFSQDVLGEMFDNLDWNTSDRNSTFSVLWIKLATQEEIFVAVQVFTGLLRKYTKQNFEFVWKLVDFETTTIDELACLKTWEELDQIKQGKPLIEFGELPFSFPDGNDVLRINEEYTNIFRIKTTLETQEDVLANLLSDLHDERFRFPRTNLLKLWSCYLRLSVIYNTETHRFWIQTSDGSEFVLEAHPSDPYGDEPYRLYTEVIEDLSTLPCSWADADKQNAT